MNWSRVGGTCTHEGTQPLGAKVRNNLECAMKFLIKSYFDTVKTKKFPMFILFMFILLTHWIISIY